MVIYIYNTIKKKLIDYLNQFDNVDAKVQKYTMETI